MAQPIADGSWKVPEGLAGQRLDGVVRALTGASWGAARKAIASGKVRLDERVVTDAAEPAPAGAEVVIAMRARHPKRAAMHIDIVHLDAAVVVVNKPAGVSTVPFGDESPEEQRQTLDARVRAALSRRLGERGRPPLGVVQRLDKETSGVLVFARTLAAKRHLAQQLRVHTVHRRYLALAHGTVRSKTFRTRLVKDRGDGLRGSTDNPRLGQLAVTHVEALRPLAGATLVACRLETGRTHQIRIHLSEAGHPIVGEPVYLRDYRGPRIAAPRLMLHAFELGFVHPTSGEELFFKVDPPDDFAAVLARLTPSGD